MYQSVAEAAGARAEAPGWLREKALQHDSEGSLIRSLSKKQRQEYYALVGRNQQPLFDDNYDDTVCLDDRHREAMIAYVHDNPRRALLRKMLPDVMRRCLHVRIGNRSLPLSAICSCCDGHVRYRCNAIVGILSAASPMRIPPTTPVSAGCGRRLSKRAVPSLLRLASLAVNG